MQRSKFMFLFLGLLIFSSCAPRITKSLESTLSPLGPNDQVHVLTVSEIVPTGAKSLGSIKAGDSGLTTDCDYSVMIGQITKEARAVGGNLIKITEHKSPDLGSSCHRISAIIYHVDDTESLSKNYMEEILDVDYAILNIYRYSGTGMAISYVLKLDDEDLCHVRNNFKKTVHVSKEGNFTLSARTEVEKTLPITLEKGRNYYIRCSIGMGIIVGQPRLELVHWSTGKKEFEAFNAKHR